jgi:hypothetical protein
MHTCLALLYTSSSSLRSRHQLQSMPRAAASCRSCLVLRPDVCNRAQRVSRKTVRHWRCRGEEQQQENCAPLALLLVHTLQAGNYEHVLEDHAAAIVGSSTGAGSTGDSSSRASSSAATAEPRRRHSQAAMLLSRARRLHCLLRHRSALCSCAPAWRGPCSHHQTSRGVNNWW